MSSTVKRQLAARARAALEWRARNDLTVYHARPVDFAREVLGVRSLTNEQVEILQSVRDQASTNVQAAHGVGKSFISAIIVLWWVFAVEGLAITTAPNKTQVEEILWREVRVMYDRHAHRLGGRRTQLKVSKSEEAYGYGFTSRDYDSNSFQGKHAKRLLLIQDEACGISNQIDEGFDACLTGTENRGLRIGNPVLSNTPFERACAQSHIRIAAWSHPNVAWAYQHDADGVHRLRPEVAAQILRPDWEQHDDPVLPQEQWPLELPRDVIPGAISISWIEKTRKKRGEDSNYWKTRVEGIFCVDSSDSLVPSDWFAAARARYDAYPDYWDELAEEKPARYGLDVGDGGDPHALALWRGPVLYAAQEHDTVGDRQDISRAAALAVQALAQHRDSTIGVDNIGVGAGALSEARTQLLEDNHNPDRAHPVNFGTAPPEPADPDSDDDLTANLKAYLFWMLREDFRKGSVAIAPLGKYEDALQKELSGIRYEETRKGKIIIEPKKVTRKRLQKSPNLADAVAIARHQPDIQQQWELSSVQWG